MGAADCPFAFREPVEVVRGQGALAYDSAGTEYLDCITSAAHVGHSHPLVVEAGCRQMSQLVSSSYPSLDRLAQYAQHLIELLPPRLSAVYLTNSDNEAHELALRLARAHTRRYHVIAMRGSHFLGSGVVPNVRVVERPDVYRGPHRGRDAGRKYAATVVEALRLCDPAAFLVESAPAWFGHSMLPSRYLAESFAAVRAAGGVCIAHEGHMGLGRPGAYFWMFEAHNVVPDIVTIGKSIGNGYPMAAVVTTGELARDLRRADFSNASGGDPVACAIATAVLNVLREEELQARALEVGGRLLRNLYGLARRHALVGDVRGQGLFIGVELVDDREQRTPATGAAADVLNRMRSRGVLLGLAGEDRNVLAIRPPLVFSSADADRLVDQLDSVLHECPPA